MNRTITEKESDSSSCFAGQRQPVPLKRSRVAKRGKTSKKYREPVCAISEKLREASCIASCCHLLPLLHSLAVLRLPACLPAMTRPYPRPDQPMRMGGSTEAGARRSQGCPFASSSHDVSLFCFSHSLLRTFPVTISLSAIFLFLCLTLVRLTKRLVTAGYDRYDCR